VNEETGMSKETIVGFIGLGVMGAPMSANVVKGGYDVRLYDAAPGVAAAHAAKIGGTAVEDAKDLAEAEVIVTMLPTSKIVRSVLVDEDGSLRIPFKPGTVIADMSSSDPNDTIETGRLLAAHGVHLVDAPVSGARPRAEDATLAIMLGADDEDAAQRAIPVIETMSRAIYRTGKLGTGDAMKALNNFVAATSFVSTAEALVAGQRFGLDPHVMIEVLNDSTGKTFQSLVVFEPHIVEKQFASGFALPLITKDIRIARDLQHSVGHDAPVTEVVVAAFEEALEQLGNVDHTLAYTVWEDK